MVLLKHKEKEKNNMTQSNEKRITIEDIPLDTEFSSLDELLDSQEFKDFMELCEYTYTEETTPTDTIEDISGFPTPERDMWRLDN